MSDERDRIWQMVTELGASERHFNGLQHQYRALCSTWMLAAFGAMGFLFTAKDLPATYPREILAAGVSVAAAVGTTLLWLLDLRVYHQLLDACFTEGLRLEGEHPWLPQIRTNMLKTQKAHGVLSRVVWFYIMSALAILIAGGSLLAYYVSHSGLGYALLTFALWHLVAVLWAFIVKSLTISQPLKTHAKTTA